MPAEESQQPTKKLKSGSEKNGCDGERSEEFKVLHKKPSTDPLSLEHIVAAVSPLHSEQVSATLLEMKERNASDEEYHAFSDMTNARLTWACDILQRTLTTLSTTRDEMIELSKDVGRTIDPMFFHFINWDRLKPKNIPKNLSKKELMLFTGFLHDAFIVLGKTGDYGIQAGQEDMWCVTLKPDRMSMNVRVGPVDIYNENKRKAEALTDEAKKDEKEQEKEQEKKDEKEKK